MFGVYALGILFFIISLAVSSRLKSKFKKYSQTPLHSGLSGAEIAKKMLKDSGFLTFKWFQLKAN